MSDPVITLFDGATPTSIRQWLDEKGEGLSADDVVAHGKGFFWGDEMHSNWPDDYECAVELFKEAANRGSIEAKHYLSICYQDGQGVDIDEEKSFQLCLEAAEAEISIEADGPDSHFHRARTRRRLGMLYWRGIGTDRDPAKGLYWYEQARLSDDAKFHKMIDDIVDTDIAMRRYEDGEYETAAESLKQVIGWPDAELRGNAVALYFLGILFLSGDGVQMDAHEAFDCFERGAKHPWSLHPAFHLWEPYPTCFALCQFHLGQCLLHGMGIEQDEEEAVSWFRQAADSGLGQAYQRLGVCHVLGQGVREDRAEARRMFQLAIEHGCEQSHRDIEELDREDRQRIRK